jgi:hypothetical protein
MGIEALKNKLRKRVAAAAAPVKRHTFYYKNNKNELKTHLYIKGVIHDCGIDGCPSSRIS